MSIETALCGCGAPAVTARGESENEPHCADCAATYDAVDAAIWEYAGLLDLLVHPEDWAMPHPRYPLSLDELTALAAELLDAEPDATTQLAAYEIEDRGRD
jgi:hypothetical protein